ncbi:hypothetical protein M0208_01975 [Sphingomonas sp. SUN019]|uniref:hypothetical protein n=1 Tax=Sphingomonas sp. SUN019 TaxID=2937788 RepID=UPI00216445FC|nr:hypothetical protein [Sphingomonas sp. SUN019]UVO49345.1 hypothetical protein M0208_01975 [Sphingomonas sp. SUN019]
MANALPSSPAAQQCVTASDLVRHFGIWQERAARAPVYILHRGRPRFALTSLDVMDALCAPHSADLGDEAAFAALLDAIDELVMIADHDGAIVATSRAVRARFGDMVRSGASPAAMAVVGGGFLSDAIARVSVSGIDEQVEMVPARYPTRRIACVLSPFPNGCLIHIHDLTTQEDLAVTRARNNAITAAIEASGAVVTRIGLRGYLIDPPVALAHLIGVARDALETVRFASLIDVSGRVAVGEAMESVLGDAAPRRVVTSLLVRGAEAIPVTIGLSALRPATRIEELVATITVSRAGAPHP